STIDSELRIQTSARNRGARAPPIQKGSRPPRRKTAAEAMAGEMSWVGKKIHLYNVTMGLYMLDWWERCLFNILVLILLWFICFNGSRFATDVFESHLKARILQGANYGMGIGMPSS
uniref:Uncharacterized protein n=3 Tax=Setaria TaxID=4554 RepID=K3ZZF5_SETIT